MDAKIQALFDEFSQYYSNLVEERGRIPRAISGVSACGDQFIFILDGLRLDHNERRKLVIQALKEEAAIIYAYGSLVGAYDEDEDQVNEELSISVGNSSTYIAGEWAVHAKRMSKIG